MMRSGLRACFFFGVFLCVSFSLAAAEPADLSQAPKAPTEPLIFALDDCIQKALAYWPSLAAARFDREAVEAQLSEARGAYFLPELKLRTLGGPVPDVPGGSGPESNFPEVDTRISDLGLFVQARVEAVQPLFTFGKLKGYKMAAEHGVAAKESAERIERDTIVHRVKKLYYSLVYLYSLQSFLDDLAGRVKSVEKKVMEQLRKHSPDVTDIDRMRLELFEAEMDRRIIDLRNGIDLAEATLGILIGEKDHKIFQIADRRLRFQIRALRMWNTMFRELALLGPRFGRWRKRSRSKNRF